MTTTISLATILPNSPHTLDGTGFLFGAGASFEAGYPLMPTLTIDVVNGLRPDERTILDEVLGAATETYDGVTGSPNIEHLADLVIAHATNTGSPRYTALETRLRELVLDRILAVTNPSMDHHCTFFEALKKRAFGFPRTIWIFTTNYDLLIETAAAKCGVNVDNGFVGATERFFCPQQFRVKSGAIAGGRFSEGNWLTIKLIKLHGSVSWTEESSQFFERHPAALSTSRRVMVLPRRKKVIDTLTPPFDALFTLASKVIGGECKYLVSCGFSFGDEHINQQLLSPSLQAGRCRLFALDRTESLGVALFNSLPTFSAAYASHLNINGSIVTGTSDLWQFSKFVTLF
jgi:SIR2-like domain